MAIAELLATDLVSVELALAAGADRIELCAALEVGGVTPGIGLLRQAVEMAAASPADAGIVSLIRPRRGDFTLDGPRGLALLVAEVEAARDAGAEGVALGVLMPDGMIDVRSTAELIEAARPMKVTFHRAFDHVPHQPAAIEVLTEMGIDRVLTSGGAETALRGASVIQTLLHLTEGLVELVAAGGVNGDTAAAVLRASRAPAIHGSCSRWVAQDSDGIRLGTKDGPAENGRLQLDVASARKFVAAARDDPGRDDDEED